MAPPAVEVRDLTFAYPDGHPALDGVNLTIEHGERVAVLGPNGAGKTTLVLHLNGIHTATSGAVLISGLTGRQATPQGDQATGRDRVPGSR